MQRFVLMAILALVGFGCTPPQPPPVKTGIDQGPNWNAATRKAFYSQDQGSQVIPLRWIKALKQPDGQPFLANNMTRYGYLTNNEEPASILPVGFTVAGPSETPIMGMTCAACHTRQIEVKGAPYRIDGGPALADFQSFLRDLDVAVAGVLATPAAFHDFAAGALEQPSSPAQEAALKTAVQAWFLRYDTLVQRALPKSPWGVSRLDAVAMIFNRLTGLDLGPAPSHMIAANILPADAPVRYPFLWNASIQDITQWPGFAPNGDDLLGLVRNLGEEFGVFGTFYPVPEPIFKINYLRYNSANFDGLWALENLIKKIGPPVYPWTIDKKLADQGEAIYNKACGPGCHEIKPGTTRPIDQKTWATPLQDVGTDSREYVVLQRTAQTGVLSGASLPGAKPLQPVDSAFKVLSVSVGGSIAQRILFPFLAAQTDNAAAPDPTAMKSAQSSARSMAVTQAQAQAKKTAAATDPVTQELKTALVAPPTPAAAPDAPYKYEARVMQGIWAAAPYLHNGSVPTLADLLKPVADRPVTFKVGPNYDIDNLGLAVEQTKFNDTTTTTDCSDRNSGNSRCGHTFGTDLKPEDKRALLEYLKKL